MISRRSCGHVLRRLISARCSCVVLLAACGFQSRMSADDVSGGDPFVPENLCAEVSAGSPPFMIPQTCVQTTASSIDITADTAIDTTAGTSDLRCTVVPSSKTCVLAASAIHIAANAKLSARGARPLALFAHTITIDGTLDVASHLGAVPGAGTRPDACTAGVLARGAGGGRGGAAAGPGGDGGNEGGIDSAVQGTGARGGATFSVVTLAGGCGGTRGGDGTTTSMSPDLSDGGSSTGGAGGGAVWIYADRDPLVIAAGAVINASGAPGAGGATPGHGGDGGGGGGLIILHAPSIQLDPTAMIFANGGPGGGGAGINASGTGYKAGTPGTDPDGPASSGSAGQGGTDGDSGPPPANEGDGGLGYPSSSTRGHDGGGVPGRGGGGGGGGAGAIRVISSQELAVSSNLSPPPIRLGPPIPPAR